MSKEISHSVWADSLIKNLERVRAAVRGTVQEMGALRKPASAGPGELDPGAVARALATYMKGSDSVAQQIAGRSAVLATRYQSRAH